MVTATQIPETIRASLASIETRPQWFQPRDVAAGRDHDPQKVDQIVRKYDPDTFEALWVVADPEKKGRYIVIAGHHRLEAARKLELSDVPVRVMEGNPNNEHDRRRLAHKADISNYLVSTPGLIEQVNTVRRMTEDQYSTQEMADLIRKRPADVERLKHLAAMPPDVLNMVSVNTELRGIAETLGEAKERGWVDEEAASHLFRKVQDEFESTKTVPSKNVLRKQIIAAYEKAQARPAQPDRLEGFGENLLVAQVLDDTTAETARQRELSVTNRRLTSCQQLADDLGVPIEQVRQAAQVKLDALELTSEQVDRARAVLQADPTPGATPAERELENIVDHAEAQQSGQETEEVGPSAESALNMFGEMQSVPQEPRSEAEDSGGLGAMFDSQQSPGVGQSTLGEGFETNQSLAMPMGEGSATAEPLADEAQMQAAQARREELDAGQLDMMAEAPPVLDDGPPSDMGDPSDMFEPPPEEEMGEGQPEAGPVGSDMFDPPPDAPAPALDEMASPPPEAVYGPGEEMGEGQPEAGPVGSDMFDPPPDAPAPALDEMASPPPEAVYGPGEEMGEGQPEAGPVGSDMFDPPPDAPAPALDEMASPPPEAVYGPGEEMGEGQPEAGPVGSDMFDPPPDAPAIAMPEMEDPAGMYSGTSDAKMMGTELFHATHEEAAPSIFEGGAVSTWESPDEMEKSNELTQAVLPVAEQGNYGIAVIRVPTPVAVPVPVAVPSQPDEEEPVEINITVTDAPAVELAPTPVKEAKQEKKAPAKRRKKKEPSLESCAPETIENRLEALQHELDLQEAHLSDVKGSKGSKGGVSKMEREELAKRAVGLAKSRITREKKKLGESCPIPSAKGKGRRATTHPAVRIRNAARRDLKAKAAGRK